MEALRESDEIRARALDPTADRDLGAAGVEPDSDRARVLHAEFFDQRGPFHRRSADDHAADAGVEELARRIGSADPAAHLHRARHRFTDRSDLREVRALTGARGVEIHDVDPARACGSELARDAHRVVVIDGLRREVALVQADAVPAAQVDRREEIDHRVPLVDGTPVPSTFTASRSARATPLNDASITW